MDSFIHLKTMRDYSRNDVKEFLREVKKKISPSNFKEFVNCIKSLSDKNKTTNRKAIYDYVFNMLGKENQDLYFKFEALLSRSN